MALELVLAAVYVAGALLTIWAVVEIIRVRAWGWLIGVVLWPVGVIAWFVAGRRIYASASQPPDRRSE